ncbi:sugar phosphate isomerase [Paraglaciecola hydrolytica]|uniref:Sugar phosphate isomerase n=1 Tax=Paraglaciecola hydrolytica TaxID=1799789 RepID=A0A148KML7_9ALTE|nr:sugar phosphate isomerase [Paraglaciecola hydrolytica]
MTSANKTIHLTTDLADEAKTLIIKTSKNNNSVQQEQSYRDKIPPLSVQLWSIKDELKADFTGTLKKLAELGFKGVEFASDFGPYQTNPAGLKTLLDSFGLKASGAHVNIKQLDAQNIANTLDFMQTLGVDLVIVPWDKRAWHPDGVKQLTQELNEAAAKASKWGINIGFHNHDKEFNNFQKTSFWDYIASHTANTVVLQLDAGWVNFAGKDPIAYVKKYPGRTLSTHFKIRTKPNSQQSPILGQDKYDWGALLKANIAYGGTQWIVLEQEEYPEGVTPLEAVALSKSGLDKIIAEL